MKLVLYGSFPASEAGRIARHLSSDWEVVPVFNEAPAEAKRESLADAEVVVTSVYRSRDPPAPKLRLLQCSSTGTRRSTADLRSARCSTSGTRVSAVS